MLAPAAERERWAIAGFIMKRARDAAPGRARVCMTAATSLLALAICFTTLSASALAQQPPASRIGYLSSSAYLYSNFTGLFVAHMDRGQTVLTRNFVLLSRSAADSDSRLPGLATELVGERVNVIVAEGIAAALAAKAATRSIPIIFAFSGDPVQLGLVQSLARPGSNVTGITSFPLDLIPKRLQLLKEIVPRSSRVGDPVESRESRKWCAS